MLHEELQELHWRLDHVSFLFIGCPLGIHEQLVQTEELVAKGGQGMSIHAAFINQAAGMIHRLIRNPFGLNRAMPVTAGGIMSERDASNEYGWKFYPVLGFA